jgi:hypothetical protein
MAPRLGLGGGVSADPASGLFGAPNLLLDNYPGADIAYSIRKLSKDYAGYAMKIRVDIDDDGATTPDKTADVAFDDDGFVSASSKIYNPSAGGSDGDTLAEFVDTEDEVYCHTWYDQSGNTNNATDTSGSPDAANQPKIYTSNSLITDVTSGTARVALLWDAADLMHFSNSGFALGGNATFFVSRSTRANDSIAWTLSFDTSTPASYLHFQYSIAGYLYYENGLSGAAGLAMNSDLSLDEKRRLFSYLATASAQTIIANGVSDSADPVDTGTPSMSGPSGFGMAVGFYGYQGKMQEFIHYDTDQTSNNADIVSDINTALEIY